MTYANRAASPRKEIKFVLDAVMKCVRNVALHGESMGKRGN
jgi:hypothetical protein